MYAKEALSALGEGERLLEELSPLDPDHETVALAVAVLRELRETLSTSADETQVLLAENRRTIEAARAVIRSTRRRCYGDAGFGPRSRRPRRIPD